MLYSGLVAAIMQAKNIDAGPAQRILLNLVEVNSAMIGSNLASGWLGEFISKTLPALGKTQRQKSDAVMLLALQSARSGHRPTLQELRDCYIGTNFEKAFQSTGRGVNNTVKGMIEYPEKVFRAVLSSMTGGRVSPHIFPDRVDFEAADSSGLPTQLSIERTDLPTVPPPALVISKVDIEGGDLDFRAWPPADDGHGLDMLSARPPGGFPR